jgi:hypothetical protein
MALETNTTIPQLFLELTQARARAIFLRYSISQGELLAVLSVSTGVRTSFLRGMGMGASESTGYT